MKPDELPEDTNNPKPEESGEVTFAIPSSLPDSPPISGNFEELIIPQDASTPEKIPIIESENKEDKEEKGEFKEWEAFSSLAVAVAQNASEAIRLESNASRVEDTGSPSPEIEIESSNLEPQENIDNLSSPEDEEEQEELEAFPASESESTAVAENASEVRLESAPSRLEAIGSTAEEIELSNLETSAISPEQTQQSEVDIFAQSNQSTSFQPEPESQENIDNLAVTSATPIEPQDAQMRIFITGASGCIGHYIVETLIEQTDYELFLLVRNPNQLKFNCNARPGIHIVQGDMREIKRFGKLLKTMNCAVLAAAGWGGQEAIDINTFKTIELLNLLNPKVCQHVIYFSTASVLNRQNQLLKEAGQAGTDYIRSKYDFLRQVIRLPIAKRITTVFPTMVLGGDETHPYSHVSGGLPELMKETEILRFLDKPLLKVKPIDLIRFFKADGSFHFIHARDIAQVVRYLLDHPPASQDSRWLVLGNEPVTLNEVIEEACAYLNKPITRRFNLSPWIANIFIRLFNIQMSAWDRFSFDYRHFTYQNPVNPSTFGMPVYCPTIIDVLKQSGINGRR